MLSLTSSKTWVLLFVGALACFAAGAWGGYYYSEREHVQKEMHDSLTQIALNLQAIQYLRDTKQSNAIDLINANNEAKLVFLKHNEQVAPRTDEFNRLRTRTLSSLKREWTENPRSAGAETATFKKGPEWESYQRELQLFLERNSKQQ